MKQRPAKTAVPTRRSVLLLAAHAQLDPRTARRVLVEGIETLRNEAARERARDALAQLGPLVEHG